jgi:CHAT domain-containing protein
MHHGSQSVVASLWSVNSDATTRLTDHFFELLLANPGMDKARALQQAKLKTMPGERGLYALPFYWAPFVLVGAR